jgi:carboxymethylenebutenolidase
MIILATSLRAEIEQQLVTYRSGDAPLQGWIYQPPGKGPFPAVLYNHGSDKIPGWFPTLGKFWTDHGFVFFVPHRSGHGRSPGAYISDEQQKFADGEKDPQKVREHMIMLHERANRDVVTALAWLRAQPFVVRDKCIVAGISYGGIQTVLTAEKGLDVKAFVAFSPAAMSWKGNPLLRDRLLTAIKNAPAPVFLLQAQNDYNLGPMELLGAELKRKGALNRAKLYPVFGDKDNPKDGHGGFAVRGAEVWGADVLEFVNAALGKQ